MDRMITRTDPLDRTLSVTYDLADNPVSTTNRKGQVTSRTFDGAVATHLSDTERRMAARGPHIKVQLRISSTRKSDGERERFGIRRDFEDL